MSKKPARKATAPAQHAWTIYRIRKSPAEYVGRVHASDEAGAIRAAIAEYNISDPQKQKRLIARRSA
jgi:hypothetical protein